MDQGSQPRLPSPPALPWVAWLGALVLAAPPSPVLMTPDFAVPSWHCVNDATYRSYHNTLSHSSAIREELV